MQGRFLRRFTTGGGLGKTCCSGERSKSKPTVFHRNQTQNIELESRFTLHYRKGFTGCGACSIRLNSQCKLAGIQGPGQLSKPGSVDPGLVSNPGSVDPGLPGFVGIQRHSGVNGILNRPALGTFPEGYRGVRGRSRADL